MDRDPGLEPSHSRSYAVTSKLMLAAIVLLFFVLILMLILHLHSRCFIIRSRRRRLRHSRRSRNSTPLVFYTPATPPAPASIVDPTLLNSLPVFTHSSNDGAMECAVCLSEFEVNETGRLLPSCKHCFHTECIDMWFQYHSTCPLCRTPVEPVEKPEENEPARVEEELSRPAPGGSSSCSSSSPEHMSSFEAGRKPPAVEGVSVEMPSGNPELAQEESSDTAARLAMSRMVSLTRMLSLRASSFGGVVMRDADLESGSEQENSGLTRAQSHVAGRGVER